MAKRKIDFATVRAVTHELASSKKIAIEESTMHGSPALKVKGKLLACIPVNKSAETGSLAVRIDFEQRAELLAAAPGIYYVTDHYLNYPMVLVRLSQIEHDSLKGLLVAAWLFVTGKGANGKRANATRFTGS